jgi:hypothetical protein
MMRRMRRSACMISKYFGDVEPLNFASGVWSIKIEHYPSTD